MKAHLEKGLSNSGRLSSVQGESSLSGSPCRGVCSTTIGDLRCKSCGRHQKEITDWHDIVLWRGLAELSEKYLKKGHKVYVEGRLKKRSWQDKEGNTRYSVEVVADNMTMLSKPSNQSINKTFTNEGAPKAPSEIEINTKSSPDDFMPF